MIRFTWLQQRVQHLTALAVLVVVGVVGIATGPYLVHFYDSKLALCSGASSKCELVFPTWAVNLWQWVGFFLLAVPAIIGIFWGAPMVARELESGTYKMAWTQSVTRRRWILTKLTVIGVVSMAVTGLLSLIITWWSSPKDRAAADIFANFDQRDLVPIGYAALAFAIGVVAGILIRRTLPAMASSLVAFVAVRLAANHFIRPNLLSPLTKTYPLGPGTVGFGSFNGSPPTLIADPSQIPNTWTYSAHIVDNSGHVITSQYVAHACPALYASFSRPAAGAPALHVPVGGGPGSIKDAMQQCIAQVSGTYHEVVKYQPSGHYWPLQWLELAVYVGAALVLAGAAVWWVRRRLA